MFEILKQTVEIGFRAWTEEPRNAVREWRLRSERESARYSPNGTLK